TTGSTSGPRVSRAPAAPRSVARPASGSMTTSRSPAATSCPFVARISATTPAIGAQKVISTFIASRNPSTCPAATRSPGVTCTPTTIAGVAAAALVGEDRGPDERIARVPVGRRGRLAAATVDPSGIDATPSELCGVEDVDEIPGVGRSALDHEVEVAERADETAPRLLPRRPRRDHL